MVHEELRRFMWRKSFETVRNIELCRTLWAYVRRSVQIPTMKPLVEKIATEATEE